MRRDEKNNLEIFEVDFANLAEIWRAKLAQPESLGEFEFITGQKILAHIENADSDKAIFAIMHEGNPVRVDMKTGRNLAKLLRETHESVVPSKLMNEREWNTVIGFGQIDASEMIDLLRLSYRLATEG
ncbi:MAG: hypothetical protein KIG14_01090 [Candidatus Sacchiramonaceae bacterium]|nr:hypothetical protein [Candidatus Saccharimonadaceae bacterium]